MIYDVSQKNAIEKACNLHEKVTIITGGAGSGKTTVIKGILETLECELMSPTGKAAARMQEVTGQEASTIHRALGYNGLDWLRCRPFENPIIIDEASMIDSALMAKILEYWPFKMILVGDDAQLEPVGVGSPFKDLIRLLPDNVCRLTICHRASGAVHKASQAIRNGVPPLAYDKSDDETFRMLETGDSEATMKKLLKWIKSDQYDPSKDMILSPRYGTGKDFDGGIDSINNEIKKILNPSKEKLTVGDRIIVTKNHAGVGSSGIWNGDLGYITDINVVGEYEIRLDRNPECFFIPKECNKDIKLAYCLSIHKAQGSEARNVFFICLKAHIFQLNRPMVYTAVTRAKKAAIVFGQLGAFYSGLNKINEKKTILQFLERNKACQSKNA